MTLDQFERLLSHACFDTIVWTNDECYKVTSYNPSARLVELEVLGSWGESVVINGSNYQHFEVVPTGQMKAVMHMTLTQVKNMTLGFN
jgi:hypothetical protein